MKKRYLDHKPKTVILLGMGPSISDYLQDTLTQELTAKYCDEIWAINMAANAFHHDVCFWMDDLQSQYEFKPGLIDLIRRRNKPVITSKQHPELFKHCYDYPVEDIARIGIPAFGKPYLNNSVAQAVGYAMHKGVKCLKMYGADFTYPNRNFAETGRACTESWVTLASITGMEIKISPSTSLFDSADDHGVYGFAEQPEINLGNGHVFKYLPRKDFGKYVLYSATDSSGTKGQIDTNAPVINGAKANGVLRSVRRSKRANGKAVRTAKSEAARA